MATVSDMLPINTAICSFGLSGEVFHAPLISSNKGFKLKTILQRSNDTAKNTYPNVEIVKDFNEIIADGTIELVVVNTPNTLHFPMAEAALNAGKNVVIEKPFTPTSKEAAKLIEIANAKGLILSVFHNKRLENDFLTLKKILDHKLVGDAVTLSWNYDRYRTHITHKNWKEKKVPGAGTLYDLGVHLIDATLSLLGAPNAVTAHTRILRNGGESTDYFTIRLDYQQLTVHLSSSTMVREQGPQLVLHGTLGSYVKYGTDPQENQLKIGLRPGMNGWGEESSELNGILHTEINGELIREKYPSVKSCYEHFYTNIFDAIRLKNALMVKPEQALLAIQIIELAEKSNTEHRTVYLSEHESVS